MGPEGHDSFRLTLDDHLPHDRLLHTQEVTGSSRVPPTTPESARSPFSDFRWVKWSSAARVAPWPERVNSRLDSPQYHIIPAMQRRGSDQNGWAHGKPTGMIELVTSWLISRHLTREMEAPLTGGIGSFGQETTLPVLEDSRTDRIAVSPRRARSRHSLLNPDAAGLCPENGSFVATLTSPSV
jgi:hypothetical protein